MTDYIALIHKDPGSGFGVSFPDFPGCVTAGDTLDEARALAAEALQFHVEGMREDGDIIPAPSSLDVIMRDRENRDGVAFLVPLKAAPVRTVRVNITLPEDTLAAIDGYAQEHGYSRSGFIVAATKQAMVEG